MTSAIPDRIAAAFGREPGRPAVTFYDQATGERVELSWTTTANWVAKCANLLVDELDVQPGDPVAVDLPPHWLSVVLLLACWQVGAQVRVGAAAAEVALVRFAAADPVPAGRPGEQRVVLSLAPMGAPVRGGVPAGVLDLAREAPSQPDLLLVPVDVDPDAGALIDGASGFSQADLTPSEPERLLVADPLLDAGLAALLAATLLAGGSLVVVRRPGDLAPLAASERCTATVGADVDGLPRLQVR